MLRSCRVAFCRRLAPRALVSAAAWSPQVVTCGYDFQRVRVMTVVVAACAGALPGAPAAPPAARSKQQGHLEAKAKALENLRNDSILAAKLPSPAYSTGLGYVIEQLSTSPDEMRAAGAAMHLLVHLLQAMPGIKVRRGCKGGSLGKGTQVTRSFDLDILFFVSEADGQPLDSSEDWEGEQPHIAQVEAWLLEHGGQGRIQLDEDANVTSYSQVLQLKVDGLQVDLLLLPDFVTGRQEDVTRQQWEGLQFEAVYASPETAVYRQRRERAVSESLNALIRKQRDDVKGVMRLTKAWCKWGLHAACRPKSVVVEVLVLAAQQRLRSRQPVAQAVFSWGNSPKAELFRETLQLIDEAVTHGTDLTVMVDVGGGGHYTREVGMRCAHNWGNDPVKIIHPIDPTCNLARPSSLSRVPMDWISLAREARALLSAVETQPLRGLLADSSLGRALAALAPVEGLWGG